MTALCDQSFVNIVVVVEQRRDRDLDSDHVDVDIVDSSMLLCQSTLLKGAD